MSNVVLEVESYYDILENDDGELLVTIKARQGGPEKPAILYAGEEHALFYRSADQTIILDFIHPGVRGSFRKVKELLVAELRDGSIVREYMVPVRQVTKLPVPEDKLPKLDNK